MKYILAPFIILGFILGALGVLTVLAFFLIPLAAVVIGTIQALFGN